MVVDLEQLDFKLEQSKLAVGDGLLVRYNRDGSVVARHELASIKSIGLKRDFDPASFVLAIVLGALAYLAKVYIGSEAWGWVAAVLLGGCALIMLAVTFERRLRVEVGDMIVKYELKDPAGDCDGFVLSLIDEWHRQQGGRSFR